MILVTHLQAEYEKEEIDWSYIEFVDNQDVLDLIESKMGILDLLDETCRFQSVSCTRWKRNLLGRVYSIVCIHSDPVLFLHGRELSWIVHGT